MKKFFVLMFVGWACGAAHGQQKQRLTLSDAEEIALKEHPAIGARRFTALASEEAAAQAAAARYPQLTGSLTAAGAPENSRLAAGGLNNPVIYSRLASGFSISQMLLDFGRTSNLIDSSRYRAKAEEQQVAATRSQVLLDVDRSYLLALRAEAILRVAEHTVAARQLVLDRVSELAKARIKSGLDLSFATVSLEEARLLLVTARNDRKAAYANLSAALGYRDAREFELLEEPYKVEPLARDELIAKALRERPDLRARLFEADAAERQAKAENRLKYPSVAASVSAGLIPQHDTALRGRYFAAGINVSLPFLNGGLYRAREAEATMKAHAADERVKELETNIVRDLTVALLNVNTAAERVDVTTRLLEYAGKALDLAQSRYELGLSSIVELSQAQLARTSAAIQNANARYEYQIQRALLNYQANVAR